MGFITRVKCSKCGINETFTVGQGMRDFDKQVIASHFTESTKSDVEAMLNSGTVHTFENIIGFCYRCNKYGSYPSLIYFKGKEKNRIIDICKCGSTPEMVIETEMLDNGVDVKCKKCQGALEVSVERMFD